MYAKRYCWFEIRRLLYTDSSFLGKNCLKNVWPISQQALGDQVGQLGPDLTVGCKWHMSPACPPARPPRDPLPLGPDVGGQAVLDEWRTSSPVGVFCLVAVEVRTTAPTTWRLVPFGKRVLVGDGWVLLLLPSWRCSPGGDTRAGPARHTATDGVLHWAPWKQWDKPSEGWWHSQGDHPHDELNRSRRLKREIIGMKAT